MVVGRSTCLFGDVLHIELVEVSSDEHPLQRVSQLPHRGTTSSPHPLCWLR